jgi:hypothetical protein
MLPMPLRQRFALPHASSASDSPRSGYLRVGFGASRLLALKLSRLPALSWKKAIALDFRSDSHPAFLNWLCSLNLRFAAHADGFALSYLRRQG